MANPIWSEEKDLFGLEGYEVWSTRHASSILKKDFPKAREEILSILNEFYISEEEIISPGGGETSITQRLRRALSNGFNWKKKNINSQHIIDGEERFSESHEIDHFKEFNKGSIGLEIEWNNKDPFFDRDLGSFRSLHSLNAISLGIIITRGRSLQEELFEVFKRYYTDLFPFEIEELPITNNQKKAILKKLSKSPDEIINVTAKKLYSDKYGEATTHMRKLEQRIKRGLGNPCPLILIGIGKGRLNYE